ncbi:hypothetical protein GIB67_016775, partial [Kingdonia uniflora]
MVDLDLIPVEHMKIAEILPAPRLYISKTDPVSKEPTSIRATDFRALDRSSKSPLEPLGKGSSASSEEHSSDMSSDTAGNSQNESVKSRVYEICVSKYWNPPLFECCKEEEGSHFSRMYNLRAFHLIFLRALQLDDFQIWIETFVGRLPLADHQVELLLIDAHFEPVVAMLGELLFDLVLFAIFLFPFDGFDSADPGIFCARLSPFVELEREHADPPVSGFFLKPFVFEVQEPHREDQELLECHDLL